VPKKTITAAAVYARLSQDRNGDSLGIARQVELCEKVAKERGWRVAEIYQERNVSAYSGAKRPAFERLKGDIRDGRVSAVIAVDQDRLARRLGELNEFIELCAEKRALIVLLSGEIDTTTADGVMKAQFLGVIAQNESAKKSERIKRQRDQAAKLGVFTGGKRPYGFEPDGMTHRRDEVKVIRECAKRLIAGESLRSVTMRLNERGIPAAKGGRWIPTGLRDVLVKPRLAGLRVHHGEVVGDAAWKPIIDRDTHERLLRVLKGPSKSGRGRPPKYLLSGFCRCSKCGKTMFHARVNGVRAYRCPDKSVGGCNGTTVVAEPLEELIADAALMRLDTPRMRKQAARKPRARTPDAEDLADIEHDLEALAADFGAGRISRREWLAAREPLEHRAAAARANVETAADNASLLPFIGGVDPRTVWDKLDQDRKRAVLGVLIERIVVNPAAAGYKRNGFDEDRVDVIWRV
jgi:DNA invertase Pin-like site-specific DNA recombinase